MSLKLNFYYPASDYLSNWVNFDQPFTGELGHPNDLDSSEHHASIHDCLAKAAGNYGVARNFKSDASRIHRLDPLRTSLASIASVPSSNEDAINAVTTLVHSLKESYGKELVSAASKFLWFRFKSPIVIYDSYAFEGLKRLGFVPNPKLFTDFAAWYAEYVDAWRTKFEDCERQIEAACNELSQFKKFTAAATMSDGEINQLAGGRWFRERVFDWYLTCIGEPDSRFDPFQAQ